MDKHCVGFKDIDTILPRYNFKIILDTTYLISLKGFHYQNLSLPEEKNLLINGKIGNKIPNESQINKLSKIIYRNINKEFTQEKENVTCYPLLIFNNDSKPAYFKWIKMIQEAKDVDGKWKPIEFFQTTPTCVVTNMFLKFNPKQYQAFAVMKYNGNFKTKLRVKVKINNEIYYSNEFSGQINKSQFNKNYALKYVRFMTSFRDEKYLQEYMNFVFLEDLQLFILLTLV